VGIMNLSQLREPFSLRNKGLFSMAGQGRGSKKYIALPVGEG